MGRIAQLTKALKGVGRTVSGTAPGAMARHPIATTAALAGGSAVAAPMGLDALRKMVVGVTDGDQAQRQRADEMYQLEQSLRAKRQVREMESRRRQMAMEANLQVLATQSPDVYNQVLAGRPLPRGAKVFAGRPRRDLLEELAVAMSDGKFPSAGPSNPMMGGPPMGQIGT